MACRGDNGEQHVWQPRNQEELHIQAVGGRGQLPGCVIPDVQRTWPPNDGEYAPLQLAEDHPPSFSEQ